jgi:c-di-GMP-related signal transduction protein
MNDPEASAALVHQPVTDVRGQVTAYSLHDAGVTVSVDDVLDAEYDQTDLAAVSGGRPLLLQATRRVLTGSDPGVVAHLTGAQVAHPQVQAMVAWRHARGLATSLGRFTGDDGELQVLPMVGTIGMDTGHPDDQLGHLIDLAHGVGARVMVEQVHTASGRERAFSLGADLVEGWVVPDGELERGGLAAGELTCLELLGMLAEDPVDLEAVTGLVAADPNLSVGVLHLVNSAVFSLSRPVDSVRHAVVMVGPRLLWALASTSLNRSARSSTDDLWHMLTRALACWELSGDDAGYTVGLLSAVADLRRVDPAWLAEMAGITAETTDALVHQRGPVGQALACVRAQELGDPHPAVGRPGADPLDVSRTWLAALPEALGIARALTRTD